jgi:hypothetical protein
MFIIYGKKSARIKQYIDQHQNCKNCGAFDLEVKVYKEYYHLFFIPVFPIGIKTSKITCRNCGHTVRLDSVQKHYEDISRTPIYFYTVPILFAGLILVAVNSNLRNQKEKAAFVANPQVGDVYRIAKDENYSTTYYFLRLANINGDTVIAYHNNLEYHGFTSTLEDSDFFVKDEKVFFLKSELKQMLDKHEINAVERNYDDGDGFNRIK